MALAIFLRDGRRRLWHGLQARGLLGREVAVPRLRGLLAAPGRVK